MNECPLTLDAVLSEIAARLARAAADRRSAMRVPVVGTAEGNLRMMVLRACDPELALLRFHTDARSPKVGGVGQGSPVSILAFDPLDKVQIRARGLGRIETYGLVADAAWAEASVLARRC